MPPDPYDRNLMETFISLQKQILEGQVRIEQRLDAMEAQLCQPKKRKRSEEDEILFTEAQVAEKLQLTRQTLSSYRKKKLITFTKKLNTIRYSQQNNDDFKKE